MLELKLDLQTVIGLLAVAYMAVRSHRRKSLTGPGIAAAVLVGTIHAVHPFRILTLLLVFFLCGTKLTSWGEDIKAELLTQHSHDKSPANADDLGKKEKKGRTATQVFCNSGPAALFALLHILLSPSSSSSSSSSTFSTLSTSFGDLLIIGIVAQYACSAADTFSSEIGILDDNWPLLITTGRKVPPGTNGGVSILGLVAGCMGALIIGITAALSIPHASPSSRLALLLVAFGAGLLGTLLDSLLGATCQRTLYDTDMKKVLEMHGGTAVPLNRQQQQHHHDKDKDKYFVLGHDLLDNNQVNLVSALLTMIITIVTVVVVKRVYTFVF